MINNNNTYKQDKNFKDLTFSEGEFLTELDLDIIESRTTSYYSQDEEYENYLSEFYTSYIPQANLPNEELGLQYGDSFQIGNNMKGGI